MHTWDDAKNTSNKDKHGVGFEAAELLFDGPVIEVVDDRIDYGEVRVNAYGAIAGRLFVCCYTPRDGGRHIISMRKCNAREIRRYG